MVLVEEMTPNDYDTCKCGYNPALNIEQFDNLISEYGTYDGKTDKILIYRIDATCRTCGDKFKFEDKRY